MEPGDRANRRGQLVFADQGDRVDRDSLAPDVVPVGLGDGALRHHADLRAAADDDHALAVDALESRHEADLRDSLQTLQVGDQPRRVRSADDLELELRMPGFAVSAAGHVGDVRSVPEDGLGQAVQHARLVARRHQQPKHLRFGHAQSLSFGGVGPASTKSDPRICWLQPDRRPSPCSSLLPMSKRRSSTIAIEIRRGGPPT